MMICPECQHQQSESKIAISTYCRGCGSHYKISHGIAATDSKIPNNPFAAKSSANAKADEPVDRNASDEHTLNDAATTPAAEADQLDGKKEEQNSSAQEPTQRATSHTSDLRHSSARRHLPPAAFFSGRIS